MFINTCTTTNNETETGTLEVTGTGDIRTRNTGGSSASEGGLGSSSDDDREKGDREVRVETLKPMMTIPIHLIRSKRV